MALSLKSLNKRYEKSICVVRDFTLFWCWKILHYDWTKYCCHYSFKTRFMKECFCFYLSLYYQLTSRTGSRDACSKSSSHSHSHQNLMFYSKLIILKLQSDWAIIKKCTVYFWYCSTVIEDLVTGEE